MERSIQDYTAAIAAIVLLFFSNLTAAQTSTTIQGIVVDEQGGNIASAVVRLRSRDGRLAVAETDPGGAFQFRNLAAGEYLLECEAPGFSSVTSPGITLKQGESKRLRFELKVASISETVVITASGTVQRADEVSKVLST
ncbi:MAG TPA: carboxypeptidase-like regulatory domain-containing protein, partial [Pyrinomonadaceae bacterium]|nr:carboxypeptidase-like regulatory domain-containing protein [Pyrinomonadaceae bacterium]